MEGQVGSEGVGAVGCLLAFEVTTPATIVLQVAATRRTGDHLAIVNNAAPIAAQEILGPDGGRQHVIRANPGQLTITYQATTQAPSATEVPVAPTVGEAEWVDALRPSRYCPSDRMAGFAQRRFGDLPTVARQVEAITEYVWRQVGYDPAASGSSTDAVDTLLSARGVCRDFAHLVATLCRGIDIPARIAAVYAPGLSPMDFHAVVETAIDGAWWVWDATRLAPRASLVRIATGRDAADTAFATVMFGRAELRGLEISAVAAGDLNFDDHEQRVSLG